MGEEVGGMLMEDLGEGIQCSDHPYRSNPGGICAFCLQEKLGKLVSSSKSSNPFLSGPPLPCSSSSSSPPAFPSSDLPVLAASATADSSSGGRISFFTAKYCRSKKKSTGIVPKVAGTSSSAIAVLNRSKSVVQRPISATALAEAAESPRKKSFWSFFTLPSVSISSSTAASSIVVKRRSTSSGDMVKQQVEKDDDEAFPVSAVVDGSPSGSQASSSFGRKVARSRSVGCGSRSFSGDFLERISNGFGDCTLRRAESQRETKPKLAAHRRGHHGVPDDEQQQIKERIKCGGIFGGLSMISSTAYWLPAASTPAVAGDEEDLNDPGLLPASRRSGAPHSRNKSWAWALVSPIRAFKPVRSGGEQTAIDSGAGSRDSMGGDSNPSMLAVGC